MIQSGPFIQKQYGSRRGQEMLKNDRFLRACMRQEVDYTPIWLMRQAGRFLQEQQDVWKKNDFVALCKTPELAAEITTFPLRFLGVDAAILFSDLLIPCEAMGLKLVYLKRKSPKFPHPIKEKAQIEKLIVPDPYDKMNFVMESIRLSKKILAGEAPVIGFTGGPFTLAAYMVEGSYPFVLSNTKRILFQDPGSLHALLAKAAKTITLFLNAQIEAGADAVMIFDNFSGVLPPERYREFALPYTTEIIEYLHRKNCPVILYVYGCSALLELMASSGPDVLSIDERTDLSKARQLVGGKTALQGNIDAMVLYADPAVIKQEVRYVLDKFGSGSGHIFNVGNALQPDLSVQNVKILIETVQKDSRLYH
jgi:uroporphyrinogen decarboxylase